MTGWPGECLEDWASRSEGGAPGTVEAGGPATQTG